MIRAMRIENMSGQKGRTVWIHWQMNHDDVRGGKSGVLLGG